MENYFIVDCCLTCGSSNVKYDIIVDRYMCDTCGHTHNSTGTTHIYTEQAKKLLAVACCFICLLMCIPGTAQNFLAKPRINFDSLVLAAVHRLNVDSIVSVNTPAINMDSIVKANTFTVRIHDTVKVDSNPVATAIATNFISLVSRNLYSLGKDTFILNGKDTIKYKPIIWSQNYSGNDIALGAGEVVRLPDLTMFKPSAGYYQTLPIKVDIPNTVQSLPSSNVIVTGITTTVSGATKKKTTKKK